MTTTRTIGQLGDLNLQALYIKANEWLKDIDGLEEEVGFFKNVFQRYFSEPGPEIAYRIREVQSRLYDLDIRKHVVRSEILNHLEVLKLLIKEFITQDEETLREQHATIEVRMKALDLSFKRFKTEIFDFIAD